MPIVLLYSTRVSVLYNSNTSRSIPNKIFNFFSIAFNPCATASSANRYGPPYTVIYNVANSARTAFKHQHPINYLQIKS